MKVLIAAYAADPDRGSEPGVGWNIASELARRHEVWLVTRANNRPAIERALARPNSPTIHVIDHDLPWALRAKALIPGSVYPYHYLWHRTLIRTVGPLHAAIGFDVAHWLTLGSFRYGTSLTRLGVPLVIGPLGGAEEVNVRFWPGFGLKGFVFEALRWASNRLSVIDPFVRGTYGQAAAVLAASPDTERFVMRHFEVASRTRVLPSIGVAAAGEDAGPERDFDGAGPLRALFVARLVHWKGLRLALAAIEKARADGIDVQLTILGRGPHLPSQLGSMVSRGAARWVESVDTLDEVLELYEQHDLLLFPSLHESGGMVVIEAMAAGLPVVCVSIGGPAVSVTPEVGFAVPATSPDRTIRGLADAVGELADSVEKRRAMSAAARRRVEAYTWENKAAALSELYESILR